MIVGSSPAVRALPVGSKQGHFHINGPVLFIFGYAFRRPLFGAGPVLSLMYAV